MPKASAKALKALPKKVRRGEAFYRQLNGLRVDGLSLGNTKGVGQLNQRLIHIILILAQIKLCPLKII